MKTLVVCTDGSDLAIEAAGEGLAILRSPDRVLVVSVVESESSLADDATGHAGPSWTPGELEEQPASPSITTPASARQHCSRFRMDIVDPNRRWVCGENLTLIGYAGQVTITQQ